MNESNASPATDPPKFQRFAFPRPSGSGLSFLLAGAMALGFGLLRSELAAVLWGSIILAAATYAFLGVALGSALRRTEVRLYTCRIDPRECKRGDRIVVSALSRRHFRLPLILVRYRISLQTADGRRTECSFDPESSDSSFFQAEERGAYFAAQDRLAIFDALAFFRAEYTVPAELNARLLVRPAPTSEEAERPKISGGEELRTERTFRRTEDLTDNRRYVPGDDPRRINWKIYGHAGELFIREGEPEPPPRSRFVILVDATVDPGLFDPELGRRAVDALAEKALGLVNAVIAAGFEGRFGFNGSAILSGDSRAAAGAFAQPAMVPPEAAPALPRLTQADGGAVVLALPRLAGTFSALDLFLQTPNPDTDTDILFLVPNDTNVNPSNAFERFFLLPPEANKRMRETDYAAIERAAADCVVAYGGRRGVHAHRTET